MSEKKSGEVISSKKQPFGKVAEARVLEFQIEAEPQQAQKVTIDQREPIGESDLKEKNLVSEIMGKVEFYMDSKPSEKVQIVEETIAKQIVLDESQTANYCDELIDHMEEDPPKQDLRKKKQEVHSKRPSLQQMKEKLS